MTQRPFIALLTAVILSVTWGSATVAHQGRDVGHIKDIYVFGDSLSDTGNMFALSNDIEPPSPPYFDGRFSNGPVWVETLAELLRLNTDFDTPITLDPLANNQAVGGAFTDTRNSNDDLIPPEVNAGILSQVDNFAAAGGRIKRKDLVIVWGGANNYVFDLFAADPEDVVDDLKHAIEDLADLGGRMFLVPNLPDLGRTPLAVLNPNPLLAGALTELTGLHNTALSPMIAELREDLDDVVIVELDIFTAFNLLLDGSTFSQKVFPCLVQLDDRTRIPNPFDVCPQDGDTFDATGVLFWDLLHPTTAAHDIIALAAHATLSGAAAILAEDDDLANATTLPIPE